MGFMDCCFEEQASELTGRLLQSFSFIQSINGYYASQLK